MRLFHFITGFCVLLSAIIYSCAKDKGRDPSLAYSDQALYDSCLNNAAFTFYKNDPGAVYPGNNGAHGTFRLKFNHKAYSQLTDNGKLPVGSSFHNGSMIVKEVFSGTNLKEYAMMYKLNDSWIWAEYISGYQVKHSVKAEHSLCINCHSQTGNRDLVDTFNFH